MTTAKRILLSIPHMGGSEETYVREAFATNWLSTVGLNVDAFEWEFEMQVAGLPAVALASGTAAMHLGLRLLGVGPGDEVFCPTLTFVATANPVRYLGAEPVFLDSDRESWNLDPGILEEALGERAARGRLPKAVIVVHLYGQCADMDPILAACGRYGVPVLEDAAEALGAEYWRGAGDRRACPRRDTRASPRGEDWTREPVPEAKVGQAGVSTRDRRLVHGSDFRRAGEAGMNARRQAEACPTNARQAEACPTNETGRDACPTGGRAAGTLGDVGVYSFNGNKIITTTGGGMLVSRRPEWVEKARFWAQQARDAALWYEHSELGYNYRMSNVLAGIGRGQLDVLYLRVEQRRGIAFRYRDAFEDLPGISLMPQAPYGLHTNWLSCFLIDEEEFGCSRDGLIRALDEANVESRPVWKPMHMQPLYAGAARYGGEVAEDLFRRGICLPSSSCLSLEEQGYVINQVRKAVGVAGLAMAAGA